MKRDLGNALRICGCLFLTVLALNGCGSAANKSDTDAASNNLPGQGAPPASGNSNTVNYDSQLQLIAEQAAVWMGDTELIAEPYFYAVTDLDQNGRLEIIQSSCQGTGLYTYTNLWEVGPDETEIVPCQFPIAEGDSQPDIITDPDAVYFDAANDCYFYMFRDDIRNGAAEHTQNRIAFSLQDGVVTTALLARCHSVQESPDSGAATAYTDADGNTIDEDAYNMAADKTFVGLTAMKAAIGWTDYTVSAQLATLTEAEIVGILETSWKGFSLT